MRRLLPLVKVAVHVAAAGGYGYFRDELYYLACARRLAWGYVDQPPLSIAILKAWTALFGESMLSIRLPPALAGAATMWVAGELAGLLGGGAFARALAMVCVLIAPEYLALNGYYSMNAFDVLLWTVATYLLARILTRHEERLWPALGATLGLGLLNKLSVLWLGLGIFAGLLLTGERRRFLTRGPWMAAGISGLLLSPHVLWQVRHGWPTREFIRNATEQKMAGIDPWSFTVAQVMNLHPLTAPVWIAGLVFCLFLARGRPVRPLGIAYLTVFLLLVVNEKSRAGYLAAAYPMLMACGAVYLEGLLPPATVTRPAGERLQLFRAARPWARAAVIAVLLAGGAATAPLALAVLPPEAYVRYAAALGQRPSTEEKKEVGELPQFFADRFGWPDMVARVDEAFRSLTAAQRARAVVFTGNYGEAGAVELLGGPLGLPRVTSGHNSFWMWGPGDGGDDVVLALLPADSREELGAIFESVEDRGEIGCRYCMPYERRTRLFVCAGPRQPLAALWPRLKHYD